MGLNRNGRWILAASVLALVGTAAWLALGRSGSPDEGDTTLNRDGRPALVLDGEAGADLDEVNDRESVLSSTSVANTASEQDRERTALASVALTGRVLDPDGAPVAGAVVSWTPLPTWVFGGWRGTVNQDVVERDTLVTQTDASGTFAFTSTTQHGAAGSVLWATHTGHVAVAHAFPAGAEPVPHQDLRFADRALMRVRVIDGAGEPVPGASVIVRGEMPATGAMRAPLSLDEKLRAVLVRRVETDSVGRVALSPFPGEQVVQATLDDRASLPWRGTVRPEIVLTLGATFTLEGTVSLQGEPFDELGVLVSAERSGRKHLLTRVPVEGGAFGPMRLPVVEADAMTFRMEGGMAIPVEEVRAPPTANERVQLAFDTTTGLAVWLQLWTIEDEVIPVGEVDVLVRHDGTSTRFAGAPRDDGFILLRGVPPGSVTATGRSPGYATSQLQPFAVPEPEPETHAIRLARAGSLAGRVTSGGAPVESFEIVHWPTDANFLVTRERFEGEDGSFQIDDAAWGEVAVMAVAPGLPASEIVRTEVRPDATAKVELEIPAGRAAHGRITDLAGAAIADASVQPHCIDRNRVLGPTGALVLTDAAGRYRLGDLPPGRSVVLVTAPGFSPEQIEVDATEAEVDLGTLALWPRQPLDVRLVSGAPLDLSACTVSSVHTDGRLPERSFSPDGHVRYESVDAGFHTLSFTLPDGSHLIETYRFIPGADWVAELAVGGPCRLVVEVGPSEVEMPPGTRVFLTHGIRPAGREIPVPEERRISIDDVQSGPATLGLLAGDGVLHQMTVVELAPGVERLVELSLTAQRTRVRVVAGDGQPISEVDLAAYDANGSFYCPVTTDADGEATLPGLPQDRPLLAALTHPTRGECFAVPFTPPDDPDDVVELVFEADHVVAVRLLDGDRPVPGLLCELRSVAARLAAKVLESTDAGGVVRWDRLSAGSYLFFLRDKDYFDVDTTVEATADGTPTVVQVRQRGALRFELTSASGLPVGGQAVEVFSLEKDTAVGTWLANGSATSTPGGLVTDTHGRLTVSRIPHGPYRWRLVRSGETIEGAVEAPPGGERRVPILLP